MKDLPGVKLVPKIHENEWQLFIVFDYHTGINTQLRKLKARWSPTHTNWYLPYNISVLNQLKESLEGLASIDCSAVVFQKQKEPEFQKVIEQKVEVPEAYITTLLHRRFSESTQKTYISMFRRFVEHYKNFELETITKDQIVNYLLHLIKEQNISTSTQNQVINAIKFYYEKVLEREVQRYWIDRPQREFKLPVILSEEEVMQLFSAIKNLKHLAIAALLYSAGLRRGEVIRIRKGDIDIHRKQIKVVKSKGNKDRMTVLSDFMGKILTQYVKKYKPTYWLFEGENKKPYSPSSVASIIKKCF